VLEQLLGDAGRALDDLAGGDLVDDGGVERTDAWHGVLLPTCLSVESGSVIGQLLSFHITLPAEPVPGQQRGPDPTVADASGSSSLILHPSGRSGSAGR